LLVFYPLVFYPHNTPNIGILYTLFLLILVEAIIGQIALDTKDIKSDKEDKLLTFPVIFNKENSINFMKFASIFSFIFFSLIGFKFNLGLQFYIILFGAVITNFYIAYKIKKEKITGVLIAAAKFFILFCLSLITNLIL